MTANNVTTKIENLDWTLGPRKSFGWNDFVYQPTIYKNDSIFTKTLKKIDGMFKLKKTEGLTGLDLFAAKLHNASVITYNPLAQFEFIRKGFDI